MLTRKAAHRKDLSGKPASFTHQHFRKVAEIVRGLNPNGARREAAHITASGPDIGSRAREIVAEVFADALASTNPNFDRARFLRACGTEAE